MQHIRIILILFWLLNGSYAFGQVNVEKEIIASTIKSVFKKLPSDTVFKRKGKIKKIRPERIPDIILVNETETYIFSPEEHCLEVYKNKGLSKIDSECYSDINEKNESKINIDSIPNFEGKIQYLTSGEINQIFENGYWNNYHNIFGWIDLVRVSRPGLNEEKNKAFIYFSSSSDGLSGIGFYLILEKVNNIWTIKESMLAWVS